MNLFGIPNVEIVGAVAKIHRPNPDVGDILVIVIAIEPVLDVALQVDTMRTGSNGIVPTVYGCGIQIQAYGLGIGLGEADPIADLKFGFRLSFFCRLRRNGCLFFRGEKLPVLELLWGMCFLSPPQVPLLPGVLFLSVLPFSGGFRTAPSSYPQVQYFRSFLP